jgi:hypothetical protein
MEALMQGDFNKDRLDTLSEQVAGLAEQMAALGNQVAVLSEPDGHRVQAHRQAL